MTQLSLRGPRARPDMLLSGERLPIDVVRMIACRGGTGMMPSVAEAQGVRRCHLAELFRSDTDIIPEPENGVLRVCVPGTVSEAGAAAIAGLPGELNRIRTVFPGTGLRMV